MKCKKEYEFVVLEALGHIEMRTKTGEIICSVCCLDCVKDLEKAIKKLKRLKNNENK